MAEGYYYTLSAIAQSFAAIIALSTVFIIYKLQIRKYQRDELIKKLRKLYYESLINKPDFTSVTSTIREAYTLQVDRMTDDEVINSCRGITGGLGNFLARLKETLKIFEFNESFPKKIIAKLKVTLIINGMVILLSLILLPWKNLLPNFLQYIILGIVLLLSICALLVTINAILFTIGIGEKE